MSFNLEEFIKHPSKKDLDSLLKPQLKKVAQLLNIEPGEQMKKVELKHLVLDHLIEEDIILDDELNGVNKVEIKRLELEHDAREQERNRECQLRMRELVLREQEIAAKKELDLKERELEMQKEVELKEKELQMQYKMKELELKGKDVLENKEPHTAVAKEDFDFTRHVKMVPSFQEHEVEKFFLHFEKIAANLHWLSGARTMLLQTVLIGKAREVYSALSVEQSTDYDLIKSEILRAYELVPEAYRQKFRDTKCQEGKTYMEFARQKEALFNRWCASQQVGNNYEKLKVSITRGI